MSALAVTLIAAGLLALIAAGWRLLRSLPQRQSTIVLAARPRGHRLEFRCRRCARTHYVSRGPVREGTAVTAAMVRRTCIACPEPVDGAVMRCCVCQGSIVPFSLETKLFHSFGDVASRRAE